MQGGRIRKLLCCERISGAFELALALGRAVGPEEVEGFNYGSPYMHMTGAIRSAKANKGSGRGKTLDTLLSEALGWWQNLSQPPSATGHPVSSDQE